MKKFLPIVLVILCLCCFLVLLTSCNNGMIEKQEYETRSQTVSYVHFNTVSTISSYGDTDADEFANYVNIADEVLGYYHKLFDIYYEYAGMNNIKTINDNAGKSAVEVDSEIIDFLLYCKQLYELTNGKTNIMLGSVLRIWHDTRELADENGGHLDEKWLPTQENLSAAATHTSIELLVIDEDAKTVYISDPEASIDVGAIAKGYAANKLAAKLKSLGADSMANNAGGNIITIGLKPNGNKWATGITNPDRTSENNLICKIEIGEIALVTSGDYERYFVSGSRNYHHILDPATLMPADYFASVSIFSSDSALADALSTALFCMSYEEGLATIQRLGNIDAIWIYNDGTIKYTDGVLFAD